MRRNKRACCNNRPEPHQDRRAPSSHPYARVATAKLHKNDPCTDYYVHLNLFECIAGAKKLRLTATFSISGREVAPKLGANLPHQWRSLRVRTDGFLYKLFNILDGNILGCVEIRITGIAAFHALKYFLLGTVFRSNMAAPAAPL